jgi:expansin (peptidoglycan-binding protein)
MVSKRMASIIDPIATLINVVILKPLTRAGGRFRLAGAGAGLRLQAPANWTQ